MYRTTTEGASELSPTMRGFCIMINDQAATHLGWIPKSMIKLYPAHDYIRVSMTWGVYRDELMAA